jgi:hypothetical protein
MAVPAHGGKRHVMVPGGQLMAENDTSCEGWASGRCTTCLIGLIGLIRSIGSV